MTTKMHISTLLYQLSGSPGTGRLAAMVGAYNFLDHGDAVSFRFKGCTRFNYCKITLTPSDTYTVEFGRVVKYDLRNTTTDEGVYADALRQLFTSKTGLYLSL